MNNIEKYVDKKEIEFVKKKLFFFLVTRIVNFDELMQSIDHVTKMLDVFESDGDISKLISETRYVINTYTKEK